MSKIVPFVLKTLRKSKGLSQEQLAEQARVDKQTIFRLEREQGQYTKTQERTVRNLARALNTQPAVLTGDAPLPETGETARVGRHVEIQFSSGYGNPQRFFFGFETLRDLAQGNRGTCAIAFLLCR